MLLAQKGQAITGVATLARLLDGESIGVARPFTILRGAGVMTLAITPGERLAAA